jgi:hypothetical protein
MKNNKMKKIFSILVVLVMVLYSCYKKDPDTFIGTPAPPPPKVFIEYPIDLNFTIGPSCSITHDDGAGYAPMEEDDFEFYASSESNLPDDSSGTDITAYQIYSYYYKKYDDARFIIGIKNQQNPGHEDNYVYVQPAKDFNFFTLASQPGVATFSDTCYITAGSGKYVSIGQKTSPLVFSGYIDLANGTGNFSIKGSVYLKK